MDRWNNVRDRIHSLGLPYPDKHIAWALGDYVRDAWVKEHGSLPRKVLMQKTSKEGSHCLAIYPPVFWPTVDRIVGNVLNSDRQQGFLPFGDPPEGWLL